MPYLKLFHGQSDPGQQLDGWGVDGPIFGPFPYFHVTYGMEIKFDEVACHVLCMVGGFVFYGGMYYGDWSIFDGPPADSEREFVVQFAPDLANLPRGNGNERAKRESVPMSEPHALQVSFLEEREEEKTDGE